MKIQRNLISFFLTSVHMSERYMYIPGEGEKSEGCEGKGRQEWPCGSGVPWVSWTDLYSAATSSFPSKPLAQKCYNASFPEAKRKSWKTACVLSAGDKGNAGEVRCTEDAGL